MPRLDMQHKWSMANEMGNGLSSSSCCKTVEISGKQTKGNFDPEPARTKDSLAWSHIKIEIDAATWPECWPKGGNTVCLLNSIRNK